MKDILKLVLKTAGRVLLPFLKRKVKNIIKGYVIKTIVVFAALTAAITTIILLYCK